MHSFIHSFIHYLQRNWLGKWMPDICFSFDLSFYTLSVWDYSVQFCTLVASCGWNKTALFTAFRRGLNLRIHQQMAIYDDTVGLETFISKAICISQYLTACEEDMPLTPPLSVTSPALAPEPMQISFNPLTHVERERRINSGLYLYCGANGQLLQTCPARPPHPAVSTIQLNPQISTLTRLTIQLILLTLPSQRKLNRDIESPASKVETSLSNLERPNYTRETAGSGARSDTALPQSRSV